MVRVQMSASAALLTLLVTTGCAGGESTSEGPSSDSPSAASSSSAAPSDGSSTPATGSPSASEASPSVAPATGKRYDATAFTVVVPDGWTGGEVARSPQVTTATFASPDQTTLLDLFRSVAPSDPTLDEAADLVISSSTSNPRRQPDREVGGQQAFVYTTDTDRGTTYSVGSVAGTSIGQVTLTFAPASVSGVEPDPAAQQALVDSILATVQWTR